MNKIKEVQTQKIKDQLIHIISETNGISLRDTIDLLMSDPNFESQQDIAILIKEFGSLLTKFHVNKVSIEDLLAHPFAQSLQEFLKDFPLTYHEEHIHLTGSLSAEFIYPRLKKLLEGPEKKVYEQKITEVYGKDALPISSVEDVDKLIRLKDGEQFKTYLKILYLPKLVLINREAHEAAAYHMASELYSKYNVGKIRLKFTLSRSTGVSSEQIPGLENITEEDVVFGLYDGFKRFQKDHDFFDFVLSPSFRKEGDFYDHDNFASKSDHFINQVDNLLALVNRHPQLRKYVSEVDTVGDEKNLYRKLHFSEMKGGLRRLQYNGFKIRSHHGETWLTLRKGVQSVDNAMNIWHIDTLEHGLSLGINPNYYFHSLFQRIIKMNQESKSISLTSSEGQELEDMNWYDSIVKEKLFEGIPLSQTETTSFLKTKFHTAREIEHYQHDVLNRMINKKVSLVALPSSNLKLTGQFPDYKDHPFSWWEKKGVKLGVGTDNYITLSTNYLKEMLILLFSDPENLKITKLIMLATKEDRRPYISHLLWKMRKKTLEKA